MVPAAGGEAIALTDPAESSNHARWSPDGRKIAFLSGRDDGETQVWTLDRQGGEAQQVTHTAQSVDNFAWSPDSRRLLLVLQDPTPEQIEAQQKGEDYHPGQPRPWVIDREYFKKDFVGYLDRRRTHVYVLDLANGNLARITGGDFDDSEPVWSPDGQQIAFVSNRTDDADLNYNTDIWVVSATPLKDGMAPLTQVTKNPGADDSPAWSPDGKLIAHTANVHPETSVYSTQHLAVSEASGNGTRLLTEALDRMIFHPRFAHDSRTIWFLLEDSGEQNLASVSVRGGEVKRWVTGENVVWDFDVGPGQHKALLVSQPQLPSEAFLWDGKRLSQSSKVNQDVLNGLTLGAVENVHFKSADGTPIEGFVIKPPDFEAGKRYPAILDIHGGPQSQYDFSFDFTAQMLAANGYVVIHANPRGSTGYGYQFCLAIWQNWGGPDFEDVMAAVDDAIGRGWADPDRLGVMGWSYGGILTDHVITQTKRFKAAVSGASEVLYVVNYAHDMYVRWWEQEFGFPWEPGPREKLERISPFNKLQNVVTPTLVMGGEEDWNVPIINSEQLYLGLKRLGVETKLIVYPGEYHGLQVPSHIQDVYQRHLDWFNGHL